MYDKLAVALKKCSIRSYPSLLDTVSCATSYEAHFTRIVIIYLLHHRLGFTLFIDDQLWCVLSCSFCHAVVPTFHIVVNPHRHTMNVPKRNFIGRKPLPLEVPEQGFQLIRRPNIYDFKTRGSYAKPADLPKHSLAKVEEATLHSDIGKVALNSRDQVCFEIPKKFRRIKLGAKFFRFGKEHFKYPAIHGQIFPNSQAIYNGQ
ncbi:hypothetical protein T08_2931 [Trichinella sp. T8]|nr:hypothetical protein T08_2931 [Trichinella sp. T8]